MTKIGEYKFDLYAPAGFYVACRIGFAAPLEEFNSYPKKWIELYTSRGYMLFDPIVRWAYENTGHSRWSELTVADDRGVMCAAHDHGLIFGVVASFRDDDSEGQRTIGSFARSDREFEDAEIALLYNDLIGLHHSNRPPDNLTQAEIEVLALLKRGLLMKEIAAKLGVSESAIKARLKNAKLKLVAKTNTHAASIATNFGLI